MKISKYIALAAIPAVPIVTLLATLYVGRVNADLEGAAWRVAQFEKVGTEEVDTDEEV